MEDGSGFQPSLISDNIIDAAERQMVFQYQVGIMLQYNENKFLRSAVRRYKTFLRLEQLRPRQIWIPTYDIDVCWLAQLMHPHWYTRKTVELRGSVLNPDDTLNHRTTESQLNQRWVATVKTWAQLFLFPISCPGGMWRENVETAERVLRPTLVEMIVSLPAARFFFSQN
ncbi:unnamed protein product [Agarophyton chilense]|eukprot:gb/GEZJ01003629.1/.p1 GENE.gb/GEZJ01003629.1/~~gb/GEZJ01003629.1/.p1  ORF type:complete len:170 (-),score=13.67 gb/GEZJ01003629.1/:2174-2683(-)